MLLLLPLLWLRSILQKIWEQQLPELHYKSEPALVDTIRTKAAEKGKKWICGLAILDKELFVLSEFCSEVEVYDPLKLSFNRRWNLEELIHPRDMGSCNRHKCLYIVESESREILRVDPYGKLLLNWSTGVDYGYVSVTNQSNVILTAVYGNKLIEYSPDGWLIREINLSYDYSLCKSIKLTNGRFVVCHRQSFFDMDRVSILEADGKLWKSLDGKRGYTSGILEAPMGLVDLSVDVNGFVVVADISNGRVLLFDSDLKFKREILSKGKHSLRCPCRILLDESNGRLFVADNKPNNEPILIFDLK